MKYTITELARMSGVSTRTLRFYHEIGLLVPTEQNAAGYRTYHEEEVNKLQQILFYRELGVNLRDIKNILEAPEFDGLEALKNHRKELLERKKQLDRLLDNVTNTIYSQERRIIMKDNEKFKGFKKSLIEENEKKYGSELREKYSSKTIDESNQKLMNISEEEFSNMEELANRILEQLKIAFATNDPSSQEAQILADMHKRWLSFSWPTYTKEAHRGVAEMYVCDERFKKYYDKVQPGGAEFLRDAILVYTE
ncbi:MerR family transcriptional regulator [Alloiococcus sp. CFN-8]|uniref:MerR family transcriptional regulator n=1 Tax=Alloiococcus sp. CFN-8 TaxID=3416081 RepID=UPI003CF3BD63